MVSTPSSDDPPLSIEPIVGWRVWRLRRQSGTLMLVSVTMSDAWPPGEVMVASCAQHPEGGVPAERCACGLYAASSPEDLAHSGAISSATCVVGAIGMWGRVVEHAKGARSQYAYPARLRLVCGPCLAAGEGAVAAAAVRGMNGPLIAVCGRHRMESPGAWRRADRVQAQLLANYGVELLPLERVAKGLRTRSGSPRLPRVPRPLVTAGYAIGTVVKLLLTGLFMFWAFSGFVLLALAIVVGIVQSVLQGLGLYHPAEPPPVVIAEPPPVSAFVVPPIDDLPYRGSPRPPPRPFPFGVVCGAGEGARVEIRPCGAHGTDLFGFAQRGRAVKPAQECLDGLTAYSRGPHYSVCWVVLRDPSPVDRRPSAPNPWSIPEDEGGMRP